MATVTGPTAVTVRPTLRIPFFINKQPFPCSVPTPNASLIEVHPGEVVIGKYFERCVDRERSQDKPMGQSVIPHYDPVPLSKIRDPMNLLDDLIASQAGVRKERKEARAAKRGADGDKRGEPSCLNKTREEWVTYLIRAPDERVMQDFASDPKYLGQIGKFLGVKFVDGKTTPKLLKVAALRAWAQEAYQESVTG